RPTRATLKDADLRVIADEESVGAGLSLIAPNLDISPQQGGLHPPEEIVNLGSGEQNRVLDLGVLDRAVLADRRVGADVAVGQARPGSDDRRAPDGTTLEPRASLDHDAAVDLGADQLALDAPLDRVQ